MSLPPFFLGLTALFWGEQSGLLIPAAAAAVLLEGHRFVARRWELSPAHFGRISDLSAVAFLAMASYAYLASDAGQSFSRLTSWLPLVYLPLLIAQLYSSAGRIALSALFIFLREGKHEWSGASIDLAPVFFVLCLLSAGAANVRTPVFYAGLFSLTAWALWSRRPSSSSRLSWCALMLAAGLLGYAGQIGLSRLQDRVERLATAFIVSVAEANADARRSMTAMAHVGRLKQSDEVLVRLTPAEGARPPGLLRLAAYNGYAGLQWFIKGAELEAVGSEADGRTWRLAREPGGAQRVDVSYRLPKGAGVLPLPTGASSIEGLAAASVARNRLGTVKAEGAAVYASFRAVFGEPPEEAADKDDLLIPPVHAPLFAELAKRLRLDRDDPRGSALKVARYFGGEFTYSLYRKADGGKHDPLASFLLETKTGHCEHFASATVLLLRAAGIPARYATGYLIEEYSRLEGAYVARGRHAHAWALFREGGRWLDLDTTPPAWVGLESERAPWYRKLLDVASWASFRARRAWNGMGSQRGRLVVLLVIALAVLTWRLGRGFGSPRLRTAGAPSPPSRQGADSELYRLERRLAERGLGRREWEPFSAWVERLAALPAAPLPIERLRALARLHDRYRFDPKGLDDGQRRALASAARDCERALETT